MQLDSEDNVLVISHQAVLRCILGYFLNRELGKNSSFLLFKTYSLRLSRVTAQCYFPIQVNSVSWVT